jgi:hypothetical protein
VLQSVVGSRWKVVARLHVLLLLHVSTLKTCRLLQLLRSHVVGVGLLTWPLDDVFDSGGTVVLLVVVLVVEPCSACNLELLILKTVSVMNLSF